MSVSASDESRDLVEILAAGSGIICLVGAGGKKSTIYRLVSRLAGRVAVTATVYTPPFRKRLVAETLIAPGADLKARVAGAGDSRVVAYACPSDKRARLAGVDPALVVDIHRSCGFDTTLIKADGARLRRIKAPGRHEPAVPATTADGDTPVRVLANHYLGERRAIRRTYLGRIRSARHRIYITNSYFVPDRAVRRALADAAGRGADVRVLVPGDSDLPAVQLASHHVYGWLLRRGVHLHEWQGRVLHAKSAVIDGEWCTVGTFNLDWRSWRFNLELTVAIEDRGLAQAMEARFLRDLDNASTVDRRNWRYRPLSERVLEWLMYRFRRLL